MCDSALVLLGALAGLVSMALPSHETDELEVMTAFLARPAFRSHGLRQAENTRGDSARQYTQLTIAREAM